MAESGGLNLPPGMAAGDPHFYPEEPDGDRPCTCGEIHDEHDADGRCLAPGCGCERFEPDPDADPAEDEAWGDHYA